ncbi:Hypothetical predicted protein [Cloeon dipterum]|uniref:Uncharacterized protein n=1 Tax=Cloeon dipterum TaxID=197152 RepID=A0A8S1CKC0_9INSE|nr:Hypothetical predicted protein [Cloeon dipterum]
MYLNLVSQIIWTLLLSSVAASDYENQWEFLAIDGLLEMAFLKTDLHDKNNSILILGDGRESSLGTFLREGTIGYIGEAVNVEDAIFPNIHLDDESGSWIVDWSGFEADEMMILVLPPYGCEFDTTTRKPFILLLEKLLGVIGENLVSFNESIFFIDTPILNGSRTDDERLRSFRAFLGSTKCKSAERLRRRAPSPMTPQIEQKQQLGRDSAEYPSYRTPFRSFSSRNNGRELQ